MKASELTIIIAAQAAWKDKDMLLDTKEYKKRMLYLKGVELFDRYYKPLMRLLVPLLFPPTTAFAADDGTPFQAIQTIMDDFYLKLLSLTTGIAILVTVIYGVKRMMADAQEKAMVTRHIRDIWVTWFLINTLSPLVSYLSGQIDGFSQESLFDI